MFRHFSARSRSSREPDAGRQPHPARARVHRLHDKRRIGIEKSSTRRRNCAPAEESYPGLEQQSEKQLAEEYTEAAVTMALAGAYAPPTTAFVLRTTRSSSFRITRRDRAPNSRSILHGDTHIHATPIPTECQ